MNIVYDETGFILHKVFNRPRTFEEIYFQIFL